MTRPFEGIKIIDLTHVLAGPFAAYQLGVLGADVIKVENPEDCDQSRHTGDNLDLNRRAGHRLQHRHHGRVRDRERVVPARTHRQRTARRLRDVRCRPHA